MTDGAGSTPLHYAAKKGDIDIINELLQNGANENIQDQTGKIAFEYIRGLAYESSAPRP